MLGLRYPEKPPIRFASFETDKEAPMILGHGDDHRGDDRFPCGLKVRENGRLLRHAGEAPLEFLAERLASRGENFGHRTVVADDVNQKSTVRPPTVSGRSSTFWRETTTCCQVSGVRERR